MKRKVVACAMLACVLAPAAFAGCAGGSVDAKARRRCFSRCGAGDAGEPFVCTFRCYGRIRLLWVPWRGR